eukprot:UN31961
MHGEKVRSPRKMVWYADNEDWTYQFSQNHRPGLKAHLWTPTLKLIKDKVEDFTGGKYNAALVNIYKNKNEVSNWHSDDDLWLGYPRAFDVPSISLGFEREFHWRLKRDHKRADMCVLAHGSLAIMNGSFQKFYQHAVPPCTEERYK